MTKKKTAGFLQCLSAIFASNAFFYCVIAFFVVTSFWVAISSLYPMAFDEDFHVGIIKMYAEGWSPFAITQTPDADVFGSVVTDPSYLFHYMMSFPYRALMAVTNSETATVIGLRIINIALFAAALLVYRKVLLRAKVSPAIINVVLAVFVLIPVVPLLAGQINYDNLLMLIVAVALLWAIQIRDQLHTTKQLPAKITCYLVILLIFASIVKYAFLPIAVGVALYISYEIIRAFRQNKALPSVYVKNILQFSWTLKAGLVGVFLVGLGLFAQRYVVNLVQYHDPVPDCAAVLNEERCSAYGPWGRDYRYSQDKAGIEIRGPIGYTAIDWSWGMWHRLFFTLAGPTNDYATRKPLPIPSILAIVLIAFGALLLLWFGRSILRQYPVFGLFLLVGAVYIGVLWLQQYQSYVHTGRPVAINGRYLIPLLPALGAIMAAAYSKFFSRIGQVKLKGVFAVVVLLLFLQGGSLVTYVVRSEPNWYWHNSFMQDANQSLQKALKLIIIGN